MDWQGLVVWLNLLLAIGYMVGATWLLGSGALPAAYVFCPLYYVVAGVNAWAFVFGLEALRRQRA